MQVLETLPAKCTGCMSCIIACSFHHAKRFDKKMASIEVVVSKKERAIEILVRKEGGPTPSCDSCTNEKGPLCIKYCTVGALRMESRCQ